MRIKQQNSWQAFKRGWAASTDLPKTRLTILVSICIFSLGFYLGGYTSAPASLNAQIKDMSSANLALLKNYVRGKMSRPRKMTIDIKHKDFQYLEW